MGLQDALKIRPEPDQLSKYQRDILALISGRSRVHFLIVNEDGYFIRRFGGFDPDTGAERFIHQKVRRQTIDKLFRMECLAFDDPEDEENPHIHSTYSYYDFDENT